MVTNNKPITEGLHCHYSAVTEQIRSHIGDLDFSCDDVTSVGCHGARQGEVETGKEGG